MCAKFFGHPVMYVIKLILLGLPHYIHYTSIAMLIGSRQKMNGHGLDTKRATSKCIATALVNQPC